MTCRSRTTKLTLLAGLLIPVVLATSSLQEVSAVTTISQLGTDIDGEASSDRSGTSVAMSTDGTRIAIGAPGNDNNNRSDAGHVRVYDWDGTAWTQIGGDIVGENAGDQFGFSVAMSSNGNRIAIGAPRNDNNGSDAGHVRVYDWDSTNNTWTRIGSILDPGASDDQFGFSVAMSSNGNRIAIGAPFTDDGQFDLDLGTVRVYDWDSTNNTWTRIGSDIDGDGSNDESGTSVAMSSDGNRIAIGAPDDDDNGSNSGHVRVYDWDSTNNTWTRIGSDIDGEAAGDLSGRSVSMSSDGNRIAIGAPENDGSGSDSGHVRVYELSGNTWRQIGSDIDGEAAGDQSGRVSMSSDGNRIAIGAPTNGDNASFIGHVRVYELRGSAWVQIGIDIDGEAAGDRSGQSVAMSSDGTRLAIGAPENDGNTANSDRGHVRVYELLEPVASAPVLPVMPVWRATLDPNGGSCRDSSTRNEPWVSVFVGYRYLPSATDCTRPGHVFAGWADTSTPTVVRSFPLLSDPSDNTRRYFVAENLDLIAVWNVNETTIGDLVVFANFLCGPCTTAWLIHEPVDVDVSITVDETSATCNQAGAVFGLTVCELTNLTPGNRTVTVTPLEGKPTSVTFTLRG